MSARLLLEIAIRVLGLWFVFTAISGLAALVYLGLPGIRSSLTPSLIVASVIPVVVQGLVGVMVTWLAPWLAVRFYPADREDAQIQLKVGPGDVYRVACFLLGAYFLVHAAEPASRLAVVLIQGALLSWQSSGSPIADAVAALIYLAAGILLVFGSRPISELLANLRYDPDTIPRQQISLAVLLTLILLLGLVLGVVRWVLLGGP